MRYRILLGGVSLAACLATGVSALQAQGCPACQDCQTRECAELWGSSKMETVTGTVSRVDRIPDGTGGNAVHLLLETSEGPLVVHLGPGWYLDRQDEGFGDGDELEITGVIADFTGGPALIAGEVRKGDAVMRLRGGDGYPAWEGWRGGHHRGHHHGCGWAGCRECRPPR